MPITAVVMVALMLVYVSGAPTAASERPDVERYVGPGACSAPNCHGSVRDRSGSTLEYRHDGEQHIRQNEYSIWYSRDRHAKAYDVLTEQRSQKIASKLRLGPAEKSPKCLACHATIQTAVDAHAGAQPADGVSCESCHGAAREWLKPHTQSDWIATKGDDRVTLRSKLGMDDTSHPESAAKRCLECHYGTPGKFVDHAMLAAGHPPLVFELDTFGFNMPQHWAPNARNTAWYDGGAWVAGQVEALRAASRRLATVRPNGGWPEFSLYDCYACHHDISRDRNGEWIVRGTGGTPPVDGSRWVGLQMLGSVRARNDTVSRAIANLEARIQAGESGPEVGDVAAGASNAATALSSSEAGALDRGQLRKLLGQLTAPPKSPRTFREAQQIAWSIDAVILAESAPRSPAVERAVRRMFGGLESARTYDSARFQGDVAAVRAALGNE